MASQPRRPQLELNGRLIKQLNNTNITFHSLKVTIQYTTKKETAVDFKMKSRNEKWSILLHNNKLIPPLPKMASVALFKLYTGHKCPVTHLHRLSLLIQPRCILHKDSNSTMGKDHPLQ
jgi:hypothetical protein